MTERGRKRKGVGGGGHYISGQCLLIATQHTSPQLSQIAIEKWPVMQLLANPGPRLPSIIKSCLRRGAIQPQLVRCVIITSHGHQLARCYCRVWNKICEGPLPALSNISDNTGQMKRLKSLCYLFQRLQWRWGAEGHKIKWIFCFFLAHYYWAWELYLQRSKTTL